MALRGSTDEFFQRKGAKTQRAQRNVFMDENALSREIIGAAIEVHRRLGPGLLESVYQQCLVRELRLRNIPCLTEVPLRVEYRGLEFDVAYRVDLLVADKIVVELKAVEKVLDVHEAQLLSYLRLQDKRLGLLINFHVRMLKDGIKRVVNEL